MDNKKIRVIGVIALITVWAVLTGMAWLLPPQEMSEAERRPLDQMPEIKLESILDGDFMADFESYTLDQFPLRDTFRQIKSLFHYYVLNQGDNNDIYVADGYAAQLEYPLNSTAIDYALGKFNAIYNKHLKAQGSKVYVSIVPDKSYYLAQQNGYLAMDYEALFSQMENGMPYATHIDLTDTLSMDAYYRTDTHWRQEYLLDAARRIAQAMGGQGPQDEMFTANRLERPFYGVYYGQAALPMEPEDLVILESDIISGCTVYNHENGKNTAVYDMDKLTSKDLYEVFLSGPVPLLTIQNPNASSDRELIVFRDSFGSSMVPLLLQDYATVTVVDIRYLPSAALGMYLDFHGQDVLFLYSTLVLNNSSTLK